MHVSGFPVDLNWFLQFIVTAFIVSFGLLYLVKNTASKYFVVDANFESTDPAPSPAGGRTDREMPGLIIKGGACVVCGNLTTKQCSGCKAIRLCSEACQKSHWNSGHKTKCKDFQIHGKVNSQSASALRGIKASAVPLVIGSENSNLHLKKILFPYEEFVELFNWEKPGFPPCGLLNCGNSCFANVVLQCLAYTRPLVAYLLEKGHRRECRRNDWCFLCEFQTHLERAGQNMHPFSPINFLSHLPTIGGNLGYGKQEDAHEFMRFSIDTMQSVCLDEFGGERGVHPSSQETTLIQHIFGGHLQSQVICTKCNNVSNQFENMMDLTVEIQGDAASLEECLDQFTAREWLHGDNMYKCDGCNEYVLAWKRLTVRQAPNILTIALKRFQSGRFGKLNKRVTFPETLDLSPYMSEAGDGTDVYKLYAVVVHVDMLNASFFGHYICYTKDFCGNWYRIDDCKVTSVGLDEVLSQGAYMLLYSRVCARPSCLNPIEPSGKEEQEMVEVALEVVPCPKQPVECFSAAESIDTAGISGSLLSDTSSPAKSCEEELSSVTEDVRDDLDMEDSEASSSVSKDVEVDGNGCSAAAEEILCPSDQAHRLVSGVTSLATDSAETCVLESELQASIVENGDGADRSSAEECALMDSLSKGYVPPQISVFENGEMPHDVDDAATLSSGEVLDEMNSANSKGKPEKVESGKGLPSSSGIKDAAGKLDGAKLKLLFQPGFLGNHPQTTNIKRDGKAAAELGELASAAELDAFIFENGDGADRRECVLMDSLCKGSVLPQNCVFEKGEMPHDVDDATTVSSGEVVDEMKSVDSRGKPEKVESGKGLPSSSGIEDAAGKLDGRNSSGAKLKPLFQPGFLGKHPRTSNIKQEMKAAAELGELASAAELDAFLVENGDGADRSSAEECALMDSLSKGSVLPQNCVFEKGEMPHDFDDATTLSSGEVVDEMKSDDSRGKPGKVESGKGLPSSSGIEDAAGKLDGRNSFGAKLEPLFQPGFLGKHPRTTNIKQNEKAAAELGELASACSLKGQSNGFVKPCLSRQNGGGMKDEGKPYFECNSLSSPNFLEKQAGKSQNEAQMTTADSVSLCNGDSGVLIVSDESINNIIEDDL